MLDLTNSLHDTHSDASVSGFGFADEMPTQDADAFPDDRLTDDEIDQLWVEEQERRDRMNPAA